MKGIHDKGLRYHVITHMEKYSVLMSVYKNDIAQYVKMSIDSMLNQTIYPNQYIIVEDGKLKVDTEKMIKSYKDKYPDLFKIIKIEKNMGLANALNEGLKYAENDLIARMDADDISLPNRCEKELKMFEKYGDLAVCGCNIDEFSSDNQIVKQSRIVPSEYKDIVKFFKKRQPFNHPTVMIRKSVIEECGGYICLRRKEDFDLFSRIVTSGHYVRNIDESLYLYRADDDNYKRRKSKENMKSAIYVYRRHWRRKGCTLFDFIIISVAEVFFWIVPDKMMKAISNKFLRKKLAKYDVN